MTVNIHDEAELREWLIDYFVTVVGCVAEEVNPEIPLSDLGLGSRDAIVLAGEMSELLGRSVSPLDFWEFSTISALAGHLAAPEDRPETSAVVEAAVNEPIAVVGLGCRFPGDINGPEALWRFLCEGRSAIGMVPPDRWPQFDDGSPETATALARTTRWGSFLSDVAGFDAEFFGISPNEAAKMDPQQRLLLEVAHEALEHAGIPADSLRGSRTGVFAGACLSEYGYLASKDLSQVDAWTGTGGALSIIANRLSYVLRSARALGGGGHGVFVVTGGDPFGLSEPAFRRLQPCHHRRCERVAVPGGDRGASMRRTRCRRRADAMHSMRGLMVLCGVRAVGWWCSSGSVMRCGTGIRCWRWCVVRRSIRTAAPTG